MHQSFSCISLWGVDSDRLFYAQLAESQKLSARCPYREHMLDRVSSRSRLLVYPCFAPEWVKKRERGVVTASQDPRGSGPHAAARVARQIRSCLQFARTP